MDRELNEGLNQAQILINLKKYDLAIKQISNLLSSFPEAPQVHFYLALVYYHKGDLGKSEKVARNCLRFNPDSMAAFNLIGIIYLNTNKPKLAKEYLRKALKLQPNNVVVLANLGKVAIIEKDFTEAKELSERGLGLDPSNEDCLNNLFWAYTLQDRHEKAGKMLEKNLSNNPGNVHTLVSLGHQCYRQHKFREAKDVFESVLAWDSNFLPGLNGLKISASADNWVTKTLLNKPFLITLHVILMLGMVLVAAGIDSAHGSMDGYFIIPQMLTLVFTIPFLGIALGRVNAIMFKPRLRHLFKTRETLSVTVVMLLFLTIVWLITIQVSSLIDFHLIDWRLAALSFCGSFLLSSYGFRMDATRSRDKWKDVSVIFLTAMYLSLIFIEVYLLWLVVLLFVVFAIFDQLLVRGKLQNYYRV
ncbi:MAG: hypothetical protein Roseis2KO_21480 [Roseivirga sp.]